MTTLLDRNLLITAVTSFLANQDGATLDAIRRTLSSTLDEAGPEALRALDERLANTGADWTYYPSDPLARRVHHVLAEPLLQPGSQVCGLEHAEGTTGRPVVIFANHLSYSDANLLEILLHRAGADALGDRLTVIAGPKVYSSTRRRFSSLCFGTIKVPQSSGVSSEDAVMNTREIARGARQSIDAARDRLRRGDALIVFAEGTRSRTRGMQPLLGGVTRYLEDPEPLILPVGIAGTDALFPVGDDWLHPVRVEARIGAPIAVAALRERANGDRRLMMDAVGLAIAAALPEEYRGTYADDAPDLDAARAVLRDVRG